MNDLAMDKAMRFVDEQQSEKPFFLVIAPTYPHWGRYNTNDGPTRVAAAKVISPARMKHTPVLLRNYASQVEQHMDRDVGRLLAHLESDSALDANTLFVFTSDNGGDLQPPLSKTIYIPNGGLRGGKRDMYEGGNRVPTM